MKRLPCRTLLLSMACAMTGILAAQPGLESEIIGSWQFGLTEMARQIPIGAAYREGITSSVLTFNADKTLRMEMPCRDPAVIKKGGDFVLRGTWKIDDQGRLEWGFRDKDGDVRDTSSVTVEGDDMIMILENGVTRSLGRFRGKVDEPC